MASYRSFSFSYVQWRVIVHLVITRSLSYMARNYKLSAIRGCSNFTLHTQSQYSDQGYITFPPVSHWVMKYFGDHLGGYETSWTTKHLMAIQEIRVMKHSPFALSGLWTWVAPKGLWNITGSLKKVIQPGMQGKEWTAPYDHKATPNRFCGWRHPTGPVLVILKFIYIFDPISSNFEISLMLLRWSNTAVRTSFASAVI